MKSGRTGIVVVLILSLVLAGLAQSWSQRERDTGAAPLLPGLKSTAGQGADVSTNLSGMDTYALGLLLGGLRGPLVMLLWTSSESQKQQHDLSDFNTKVEWIRRLQPEFDTVHIFQIWNKAYNISVQMVSLPNKYRSILDALQYADSVDRQKPDDINILTAIAAVYDEKLGNASESSYYIRRVREETQAPRDLVRVTFPSTYQAEFIRQAHEAGMDQPWVPGESDFRTRTTTLVVTKLVADALKDRVQGHDVTFLEIHPRPHNPADAGLPAEQFDPMLDAAGHVLPALLTPTHPRPANLPANQLWYDGSTLQFLSEFSFPYGISPHALGFNYYRRSQLLQDLAHEQHIQTSERVVDSRPALSMKTWAEEEGERGRRAELRLFGMDDTGDKETLHLRAPDTELGNQNTSLTAPRPDPSAAPVAIFSYNQAAMLYAKSRDLLKDHLSRWPASADVYASHLDETVAFENLFAADRDYLQGVLSPGERAQDFASAATAYETSMEAFDLILLHYYTDDEVVKRVYPVDPTLNPPQRYTRSTIYRMPASERNALLQAVLNASTLYFANGAHPDFHADERNEYMVFIRRCGMRMRACGKPVQFPVEIPLDALRQMLANQHSQSPTPAH